MPTEMEELRKQIQHDFIRERRAAVVRLAELIQVPECHDEAVELIKKVADNDIISNLQKLAQSVLEYDSPASKAKAKNERQHVFAVSCHHCQRICYYDKRDVVKYRNVELGEAQAEVLDTLSLKCTHCGKTNEVKVSLEGYK